MRLTESCTTFYGPADAGPYVFDGVILSVGAFQPERRISPHAIVCRGSLRPLKNAGVRDDAVERA
jgi:hypothetical protein